MTYLRLNDHTASRIFKYLAHPLTDSAIQTCSLSLFGTNNIEFRSRQIGLLEDVIVVEDFYVGIAKKIPVFLVTHVKD